MPAYASASVLLRTLKFTPLEKREIGCSTSETGAERATRASETNGQRDARLKSDREHNARARSNEHTKRNSRRHHSVQVRLYCNECCQLHPTEMLNSLDVQNLPPHDPRLKTGVPSVLLRNVNPPRLFNDTRLSVKKLIDNIIETIISNEHFTTDMAYLHVRILQYITKYENMSGNSATKKKK
ncbi:DNA helicase Pif1-like [Cinara cedri]|uniref:DNA helicase Pif1-like n=1 Tax=Cinara cedri TaxID=506608 RepID=A0A5E4MQX1_9HEMI|nr:DNA helicase Pif1-like [Cinara cedri]